MDILNRCPFCSGEAKTMHQNGNSVVVCSACGARGPEQHLAYRAEERWNVRVDLPVNGVKRSQLRGAAWDVIAQMGGGAEFDEAVGALGRLLGYPGY